TYRVLGNDRISVSLGSLDDPSRVVPSSQYGLEGRIPWVHELLDLPGVRTEDDIPADLLPRFASRQHPDHDT
ncbi:MAG: GFA family protein, partial [Hyphomicrobium sp.]|nr:GFA family protein [Hyphomicrobium sp.]